MRSSVARRLLLALILLSFTPTLFAEADGPDYWRVYGVSKASVLNIRRSADIASTKIGAIPYGSQCIKNRGCKGGLTFDEFSNLSEHEKQQILKQRPRWCHVSYHDIDGWVAARYLRESHCDDESASATFIDPRNHSYIIEGEKVVLTEGSARTAIAGTSAYSVTDAISHTVFVDLTADNRKDAVQVLVQQPGGSGTFYYLALARSDTRLVESYFLGDRIKILSVKVENDTIVVTYLDHKPAQAMSDKPVNNVRKRFKLDGERIVLLQ